LEAVTQNRAGVEGWEEAAEWLRRMLAVYPVLEKFHPEGPGGMTEIYRNVLRPLTTMYRSHSFPENSGYVAVLRRYAELAAAPPQAAAQKVES
jgi:hypothetical protein